MTTITPARPGFLADQVSFKNNTMLRDVALVIGFALLTAAAAQIKIPLGFTPVSITGQTFAVLLAGATLGPVRGAASQGLYVLLGAVGLPFYADGNSGIFNSEAQGLELIPTFGYLVGFIAAAYVVGLMAARHQDRSILSAVPAFLAGSVIIYAFGATFLAYSLNIPFFAEDLSAPSAFVYGIAPKLSLPVCSPQRCGSS